jgi:hypothetical protein
MRLNLGERSTKMYEPPPLQTSSYFDGKSDRPEFEVSMRRPFAGYRRYKVIGFETGFLLLDLGRFKAGPGGGNGALIGGILGGAVGAALGNVIENAMECEGTTVDSDYSRYSDDQLLQMARERKHSMVAPYDDIVSASITLPSVMDKISQGGSLVGWITLREKTLGKLKMEIRDLVSMVAAIEAFPSRVGDRVKVNVEFDRDNCEFVRKRAQRKRAQEV